jgi:cysteine synthase A
MIYDSILDVIGNTPVVRLAHLSDDLGIHVYVKLESLNPGGSHKVRIALGMVREAESKGILVPGRGQTIIEPSGGNTGIGLAIAGNILGYKLVLVIPDNYSHEKQKLLRLYGAEVVLSDSRRGNNSHGEKAIELQLENPSYVMLNQQRNPANPETHRQHTGSEILKAFAAANLPPLDYFVGGIGTGGHVTGVGETLKAAWPQMKVLGVEPEQCDLLSNQHAAHEIQGLSIGIIPMILNLKVLDGMIKVSKDECVAMARRVIQHDAVSVGISSAGNLVAIAKLARDIPKGSRGMCLIYDGVDSYLPYFN